MTSFRWRLRKTSKAIITVAAFLLDVIVAGSFVLWGVWSRKGYRWAYLAGIVLYALDGLIFLVFQDWPSFGFHLFALYFIVRGFRACGQLEQMIAARPDLLGDR